jgi:hypothetical protein
MVIKISIGMKLKELMKGMQQSGGLQELMKKRQKEAIGNLANIRRGLPQALNLKAMQVKMKEEQKRLELSKQKMAQMKRAVEIKQKEENKLAQYSKDQLLKKVKDIGEYINLSWKKPSLPINPVAAKMAQQLQNASTTRKAKAAMTMADKLKAKAKLVKFKDRDAVRAKMMAAKRVAMKLKEAKRAKINRMQAMIKPSKGLTELRKNVGSVMSRMKSFWSKKKR